MIGKPRTRAQDVVRARWLLCPAVMLVFAAVCSWPAAEAAAMEPDEAVRSAQRALAEPRGYPWYDAETEDVKAVRWKADPVPQKPADWQWNRTFQPMRMNWRGFWDVMRVVIWVALAGLAAWLVYLFLRTYLKREALGAHQDSRWAHQVGTEAERIEQLPFDLEPEDIDLLTRVKQAYQRGDWNRAIVYLFSYLLVELDRAHLIHLAKGKTNRQYLAELRQRRELQRILEETMVAFEDVFFGHYNLGAGRFEACWSRLDRFKQLTAPEVPNAEIAT